MSVVDVISTRLDERGNVLQVIYENSRNGTIYIDRGVGCPERVTSIRIDGGVVILNHQEFIEETRGVRYA